MRSSRSFFFARLVLLSLALAAAASGCAQMGDGTGSGSDAGTPCQQLQARFVECLDDFCSGGGSTTPFCGCWTQGQDIDSLNCVCIPRDVTAVCKVTTLSKFVCEDVQTGVEGLCR